MVRSICAIADKSDGLALDLDAVTAEAIKEDDIYHGVRVRLTAQLGQLG